MTNNNDKKGRKPQVWRASDINIKYIPLSSLEKFIEDNEEKDCKCGVFCDCNLEARDAHNSVLKLLKDKFIHNEQ